MSRIDWDIRREGRAWQGDEAMQRYQLSPEKMELNHGKLFWDEEQRLTMLGLMLENLGIDEAVRFGDPAVWREAVEARCKSTDEPDTNSEESRR